MEHTSNLTPKTLGFIMLALLIGVIGGFLTGVNNLKPTVENLRQNNTELVTELIHIESQYIKTQTQLEESQIEINSLQEELEICTADLEQLQNEFNQITTLNQQTENEYQELLTEYNKLEEKYMNLTTQSRYQLNTIFQREDFTISYNNPERLFISPTFSLKGETTRFDLTLWCEKVFVKPEVQFRIYRDASPIRVYTKSINLNEDQELEKYYSERSLSVVLEEGDYYIMIVVDDGILSPSPNYQSNVQIWEYY